MTSTSGQIDYKNKIDFRIRGEELAPLAGDLLSNLFSTLEKPVSEENEYTMKGNYLYIYTIGIS